MTFLSFSTLNSLEMPGPTAPEPRILHPLEQVIRGAFAGGFHHVGLDHFSLAPWWQRGRTDDDLAALLTSEKLHCSEVGVLRIEDASTSQAGAERLAALAAVVGARICTTIVLAPPATETLQTLKRCAAILEDAGVRLALEFVPYSPVRTMQEAVAICADVGWDRSGLLLDTWMYFNGDNRWAELEALPASYITEVQFDDASEPVGDDLIHESRHRRALPGQGRLALDRFVTTVLDNGYDGPVSLEVLSADFRALMPAEQARSGLDAMSGYWPSHISTTTKEPAS